jgi:hypothetical protein
MPLSDMAIRKAKTREKAYKLYDELGLYLIVSPSGSRLWRMKFKHRGVEKKLSFGSYPEVSLRDARKLRDDAREVLAEGKDPVLEKQRERIRAEALAENTFTRIANEYCSKRRPAPQGVAPAKHPALAELRDACAAPDMRRRAPKAAGGQANQSLAGRVAQPREVPQTAHAARSRPAARCGVRPPGITRIRPARSGVSPRHLPGTRWVLVRSSSPARALRGGFA